MPNGRCQTPWHPCSPTGAASTRRSRASSRRRPTTTSCGRPSAADLGCAGLLIPERDGGAGASYREAAAAAEELGSFVAPVPFLGSAVVATAALLSVASGASRGVADGVATDLLAEMAGGGVTAALAVPFATAPGSALPGLGPGGRAAAR